MIDCQIDSIDSEMDDEDNRSVSGESSIDSWVNNNVDNDSANAILKSDDKRMVLINIINIIC